MTFNKGSFVQTGRPMAHMKESENNNTHIHAPY